jgi:hypothetical protein
MSKSSKFVSLTLVVATLIVGTSTAWAGPLAKGTNTHVVDDGTVSWTDRQRRAAPGHHYESQCRREHHDHHQRCGQGHRLGRNGHLQICL